MIAVFWQAWRRVWRRKWMISAGLAALLAVGAMTWWWLSMQVATTMQVALLVLVGLVTVALAVGLLYKGLTLCRETRAPGWAALQSAAFWAAFGVSLVSGVLIPWLLMRWVPEFDGLWAQMLSMFIRWAAAGKFFVICLLWLGAVARVIVESVDGEDLHTEERPADQAA